MKFLLLLIGLGVLWKIMPLFGVGKPLPESVPEDVVWLDVRTPAEFSDDHATGALNLPFDEIRAEHPLIVSGRLDPSKPVWVYCRSGRRSAIARQSLEKLGFTVVDVGTLANARRLADQ
ncbi:MAG: rhodanese-like domain-containing protein [Kiritimatiellia bacterium]